MTDLVIQWRPSLLLVEAHEHFRALSREQRLLVELVHVITMLHVMRPRDGLARDLGQEMIRLVRSCIREEGREAGCQTARMCTALVSVREARCVVVAVLASQVC